MSLLERRRALMIMPIKTELDEWDIIWDYTMGYPEVNGFEKTVSGTAPANLIKDGLSVTASGSAYVANYVKYACPISTCSKGVVEAQISVPLCSY